MRNVTKGLAAWVIAWSLLIPVVATLPGCAAAAVGAGAGGALYFTSRGVESIVDATVGDVAQAVRETFSDMGISIEDTKTEEGGNKREITGKKGNLDVSVHWERQTSSTSKVEVAARKNMAEWDKDYAKDVLSRIVKKL
ncbi:MAG TPA: DUF3568 family protein [Gemmatimonadota bacterium]